MPRSFADDRALLLEVFTDVVRRAEGDGGLELFDRTVELARDARGGDEAAGAGAGDDAGEETGVEEGFDDAEVVWVVRED